MMLQNVSTLGFFSGLLDTDFSGCTTYQGSARKLDQHYDKQKALFKTRVD